MQLPRQQVEFTSRIATGPIFRPVTPWRPTIDVTEASALLEMIQTSTTSLYIGAGWQVCKFNPDDPALANNIRAWEFLGSGSVSTGGTRVYVPFVDLTTGTYKTTDHFWIRFGIYAASSGGTMIARAVVAMTVATRF